MSQRVDGRRWPGPSLAASVRIHSLSCSQLLSLFMRNKDIAIVAGAIPFDGGASVLAALPSTAWRSEAGAGVISSVVPARA